jgi:hypothetical protein
MPGQPADLGKGADRCASHGPPRSCGPLAPLPPVALAFLGTPRPFTAGPIGKNSLKTYRTNSYAISRVSSVLRQVGVSGDVIR